MKVEPGTAQTQAHPPPVNTAVATAANAAAIAERFADADLHALAVHEQGLCLIRLGRVADGLRMLDEALVAAVGGELSPLVTYAGEGLESVKGKTFTKSGVVSSVEELDALV